jgi:hypothetical protein
MSIRITDDVLRATKDALLDHFPSVKSAHLSEALASLFGFRTAAALKKALTSKQALTVAFHNDDAQRRLEALTGNATLAEEFVPTARTAAINANIAATHARHKARADARQATQQEAAKAQDPIGKYAHLNGQQIGFVVKTKRDKFKPFVGRIIDQPDDQDALVHVVGSQDPQDTLEAALALYTPDRATFAMVLEQPVPSGGLMGHWLNEMLSTQENDRAAS